MHLARDTKLGDIGRKKQLVEEAFVVEFTRRRIGRSPAPRTGRLNRNLALSGKSPKVAENLKNKNKTKKATRTGWERGKFRMAFVVTAIFRARKSKYIKHIHNRLGARQRSVMGQLKG